MIFPGQTLLFKALDAVTNAATVKRARISSGQPKLEAQHISADVVACQAGEFWAEADGLNVACGGPRGRVAALAKIPAHEAQRMLEIKAASLKASIQKRSLFSVASGLRCWHQFAVTVLQYHPEETLPPKCARDIVYFIILLPSLKTLARPGTVFRMFVGRAYSTDWIARGLTQKCRWFCEAWTSITLKVCLGGKAGHSLQRKTWF